MAMMVQLSSSLLYFNQRNAQNLIDNAFMAKQLFWNRLADYNTNGSYPNNSTELYNQIFFSNLCPFIDYAFKDNLSQSGLACETFAENVTSYGLDIIITYYTQNMRAMLKQLEDMIAIKKQIGEFNPYQLYNSDKARNMCIMWQYLLNPVFNGWKKGLSWSIEEEYVQFELIAYVIFSMSLLVNAGLYICYVRPKQTFLMVGLQKTKNMLSIMPEEVLYQILVSNS